MIIQPSNVNRQQSVGTAPNGTSTWQGGHALPYLPNVASRTAEPLFYMTAYPLQFSLIDGATAVTTGNEDPYAEFNVLGRNIHAVQVGTSDGSTFSATVLVESTLDGELWTQLDEITAPSSKQYEGLYQSIRVSITAYTSGTIDVVAITQRS